VAENPSEDRARTLKSIEDSYRQNREAMPKAAVAHNSREGRILRDLAEAEQVMLQWGDADGDRIKKHQENFGADWDEYERAIHHAIRAGLLNDYRVRAWIEGQRSLKDWDALRSLRKSLETGIKPISKVDFWVTVHANELIDDGKRPEEIRRALLCRLNSGEIWGGELSKVLTEALGPTPAEIIRLKIRLNGPRQNFHRWLRRLGVH
jgi:hypothetical protein